MLLTEFFGGVRLGTTDVTEKIAQQTSCLAPKNFRNAYAIVKSALTVTLQKRRQRNASFEYLVESHGLSEDLIPWMKKVYAVLQKSGELDEMRASENAVVCSVFYWVCVASHVSILYSGYQVLVTNERRRYVQSKDRPLPLTTIILQWRANASSGF